MIAALREVGIEAFLAYGTLLGAYRDGEVIGNDSDADLGYVSHQTHPVDVIRESFRIQRALIAHGYRITRYSALAFKVDVEEADGTIRGLDVFGGFLMDGNLHLMGEIREPFEESWIFPLGTTTLEGRTFPAPADPDRMLTATYGASWRVPDPAFNFEPPATTVRRLNGWFRGLRVGRARWDRIYSRVLKGMPEPSPFVQWVAAGEPRRRDVRRPRLRSRCGRPAHGRARRPVVRAGLPGPLVRPRAAAGRRRRPAAGAGHLLAVQPARAAPAARRRCDRRQAARAPGAHGSTPGRHAQAAGAAPAVAGGPDDARADDSDGDVAGRMYLEFLARKGEDGYAGQHRVRRRRPAMIVAELESWGATVVHSEIVAVSDAPGASKVCRLIVEWRRGDG